MLETCSDSNQLLNDEGVCIDNPEEKNQGKSKRPKLIKKSVKKGLNLGKCYGDLLDNYKDVEIH